MIFTDASQPTFPDPWDLSALTDVPTTPDIAGATAPDCQEPAPLPTGQPPKQHSPWRDLLADIQQGLQWGLSH